MAKPSKRLKVNKPAEDPKVADPEKQTMSEYLHHTSEEAMDDPPPEEHHVTMDSVNVDRRMLSYPVPLSRLKKRKK